MADLRKIYATDVSKEQDGVWSDDLGDGLQLKIARLKNPQFRKLYQKLTKPYERQIRNRTLSDEIENRILSQCLAKTVLLDWKKLVLDGAELPYSCDNALKVLNDPGLADFRDVVVDLANDAELFRGENLQDAEKKLIAWIEWHVEWGQHVKFLERIEEKEGITPAALLREPEVYPDLTDIADAFRVLSFSRSSSFGLGFIPLTEIESYCRIFDVEDLERFLHLIRAMDITYIEAVEKRNNK